jgi:putative acetyltransferase
MPRDAPAASERISDVRRASRELVRELGFLKSGNDELGITHSQGHALIELSEHQPLTVVELASILNLDKSTASRVVAQLSASKLVSRASRGGGQRRADRRQNPLELSAAGRAKVREIHEVVGHQVRRALGELGDGVVEAIIEGLALYARALRRARLRHQVEIRLVRKGDDPKIATIIRAVFREHGMEGPGYSVHDAEVDNIAHSYRGRRSAYYVAQRGGEVLGGAGFGPLSGGPDEVCELRKMYLRADARGLGIGARLLQRCLDDASDRGFGTCYLETKSNLDAAAALYRAFGFRRIRKPLGQTGHSAADRFYVLSLSLAP